MGFFYQALKKATGVPAGVQDEPSSVTESLTSLEIAENGSASAVSHETRSHRRFDLKHPLESLVAFLSPPVEEENIVAMEQCRVLRTRIWEILRTKNMKSLLLTSAMPAEGKTILSVNLAVALS